MLIKLISAHHAFGTNPLYLLDDSRVASQEGLQENISPLGRIATMLAEQDIG
jgi:hypothetical protein